MILIIHKNKRKNDEKTKYGEFYNEFKSRDNKIEELEKENKELRKENDYLKKIKKEMNNLIEKYNLIVEGKKNKNNNKFIY